MLEVEGLGVQGLVFFQVRILPTEHGSFPECSSMYPFKGTRHTSSIYGRPNVPTQQRPGLPLEIAGPIGVAS